MKSILFLLVSAVAFYAQAQHTLVLSDVTFTDGKITSYNNTLEKNIIIPNNFSGVTITSIGSGAFYQRGIESIIISANIVSIDNGAFAYNKLTSLVLPNSVTEIGDGSFEGNQLTYVQLPNALTSLGGGCFLGNNLNAIKLPNSLVFIRQDAFRDNPLTAIYLPESHQGNTYNWSDGKGGIYQSGSLVSNLERDYTLIDQVVTSSRKSSKKEFHFYPNPAVDFIQVEMDLQKLMIYSAEGKEVKQFQEKEINYPINDLERGLYMIEVIDLKGGVYIAKLIKE